MFIITKTEKTNINKILSLNKIRIVLILLSIIVTVSIINDIKNNKTKDNIYIIIYVVINISILIIFMSKRIILFFIIFETTIIPIFVLVTTWGNNPERFQASFYIIIYTIIFRIPFLGSII